MENSVRLRHKSTFEKILRDYKISDHGKAVLARTPLVIFTGLVASGRNTIINELVRRGGYYFIVSDTTRPPKLRNGQLEQNGVQYFFRSEKEVLEDLKNGEYLEAELIHGQQVSGMSLREIEKAASSGLVALNEVELSGSLNVVAAKPDAFNVFILPPDFEIWQQRLRSRENMGEEEYHNRMVTARRNLKFLLSHSEYQCIINDEYRHAADRIDAMVNGKYISDVENQSGRELAKNLLQTVNQVLSNK